MKKYNLKIVADENMIAVSELFSHFGEIDFICGRNITSDDVKFADVLLVRSVTRVNKDLLEGSSVRFVGSATIGLDHIDQIYLEQAGIRFAYAPGCNASAVVQYVFSVLCQLCPDWESKTVGIIGCGNVGNLLRKKLLSLNVSCSVYDPFLASLEGSELSDLNHVVSSDIVTVHTPLTFDGPHPTAKMISQEIIDEMKEGALLINAARGEVIDSKALLQRLKFGKHLKVALDVWESEPNIDIDLMEKVDLATPHIAGYSVDGKRAGTAMIYKEFLIWMEVPITEKTQIGIKPKLIDLHESSTLAECILKSYDITTDDKAMRYLMNKDKSSKSVAKVFDHLRKVYPERRDFNGTAITKDGLNMSQEVKNRIASLGFSV